LPSSYSKPIHYTKPPARHIQATISTVKRREENRTEEGNSKKGIRYHISTLPLQEKGKWTRRRRREKRGAAYYALDENMCKGKTLQAVIINLMSYTYRISTELNRRRKKPRGKDEQMKRRNWYLKNKSS
jgi:hypothetical protein